LVKRAGGQTAAEVFPVRLKAALNRAELQQKALAQKLGKTEGAITNWINGDHQPRLNDLAAISIVTGVPVDWLLGLTTNPEEKAAFRSVIAEGALSAPAAARVAETLQGVQDELKKAGVRPKSKP